MGNIVTLALANISTLISEPWIDFRFAPIKRRAPLKTNYESSDAIFVEGHAPRRGVIQQTCDLGGLEIKTALFRSIRNIRNLSAPKLKDAPEAAMFVMALLRPAPWSVITLRGQGH